MGFVASRAASPPYGATSWPPPESLNQNRIATPARAPRAQKSAMRPACDELRPRDAGDAVRPCPLHGQVGDVAHRHVSERAAALQTHERPEIELDLGALGRLEEAL